MDVRLPNGFVIKGAPSNITQKEIRRIALKNNLAKPEDFASRGVVSSLVGGTKRFASSIQTAAESVIGSPEEAAASALKRGEKINTENAPGADFSKVSKKYDEEGPWAATKEAVSQIPSAIAEMAPATTAIMASGAAGASAGLFMGGPPGAVIGGIGGALFPSLVTRYGSDIEAQAAAEQAEGKPIKINRGAALATAVPQAAIDTFANLFPIMGKAAAAKILGPTVEKLLARGAIEDAERIAKESLIKRAGKGVGENLVVQGVAQPTQVMLTRLQAGQDLLSPEAIKEYGHAAYMATLVSPIGAVGGIRERGAARTEIARKNETLDTARQKLFDASEAEKTAPDAPDLPMSALNIQRLLGIKLTEASEIRRGLYERGDLVGSKAGGKTYKLFLNRDNIAKPEEVIKPVEETAGEDPAAPGFTGEQLLGNLTERTPEELAADQVAAEAAAQQKQPGATTPPLAQQAGAITPPPGSTAGAVPGEVPLPVVRKGKQQKPNNEKVTSPENPVFQAGLQLVKDMDAAGTPITPKNFREALTPVIGIELDKFRVGHLLNALSRKDIQALSTPDENGVRTYIPPTPEVPAFEVSREATTGELRAPDAPAVRGSVEPLVPGREQPAGVPEVDIAGRVGATGKPAAVVAAPERRVEPALEEVGVEKPATEVVAERIEVPEVARPEQIEPPVAERIEVPEVVRSEQVEAPVIEPPAAPRPQTIPEGERVPFTAQPSSPDVFAPSPEQARISTEAIDTGLVPGRGIERANKMQERQEEVVEALPEEGVSTKQDSVAESLRAGNLGEALYRLKDETSGKSPLSWLADKLLNVVEVRDDRAPLIKLEVARIAREQGIDKRKAPALHAALAKEVEQAILSDIDLTKYSFSKLAGEVTKAGKPTAAAKLVQGFKPQVERMVPITKGKAQFNRATGKLEFIKPEPEQQFAPVYNKVTGKVEDIPTQPLASAQKPFTLEDLPKTASPFKKTAFGGAKVFVEGNADLKGQHKAVVERLKREGKLAEYNPKTNAFYFTEAGLTDRVILHEMTHSATVGVMKKYLSGKMGELTDIQRQGAKEIVDIYNDSKAVLGDKFKNAYESEYEFITYATTNEGFQRALSNLSAPKTARSKLRSAWDSFTIAVAKMVGLDKFALTKATETPSPTRTLEPGRGARRAQEIERVEAADEMNNALLRVIESVGDILTVPKAGVEVEPLAARRPGRVIRRRAPAIQPIRPPATQPLGSTRGTFIPPVAPKNKASVIAAVKNIFTRKGYEDAIFNLQNSKRAWLVQDDSLQRMNELQRTGPDHNATYELMTLASGKKETLGKQRADPLMQALGETVVSYNKKRGFKTVDEAAEHLGVLRMAMHELERRKENYVENVPLKDAQVLTLNNRPISPAGYRDALLDYTTQNIDLVTNGETLQIRAQLEQLAQRYGEIGGKSRSDRVPVNAADVLDMNSPHYQVVGYDNAKLNAWRNVFAREMRRYGPEIQKFMDAADAINNERIALEREANYWTQPIDNIASVYGYKYYVPLKSMEDGTANISFDLDANARAGVQFRQFEDKAQGHKQEVTNPIFQMLTDLDRAVTRVSTMGITESIKNQIAGPNITLEGKLVDRVSFADKFNGVQKQDLSNKNVFFHNMPDGSTEVYSLANKRLIEGLHGFNTSLNSVLQKINSVTRFAARQHTFYNIKFAPYNFGRDVLTNSYNAAGKFGLVTTTKILGATARNIVESGLFARGAKISWLYDNRNFAAIKNMKGQFAKNAYEYIVEEGGRASYQKTLDVAQVEKQTLKNNGYIKSWDLFQRIFTTYADAFEFTSRVSAYGVIKNELTALGKARGLNINDPVFKKGVQQGAAAFTKNTFNYESVGKHGKELGSLYMFMRPALTSAARVMDTFLPAIQSVESAMEQGPSILKITDPTDPQFARAETARKAFKENYAKEKNNALLLGAVLAGAGALIYNQSLSIAPTDSSGLNIVATDDMSMWTRNARIPMKFAGDGNDFINGPWGYGPGAFGAFGAQIASYAHGNQSFGGVLENLVPITLDSFLPIPAPRFSPLDHPSEFILDTVAFSAIRPLIEFSINTDSLGRRIHNDRMNKYGDAYSAGQNVPQFARDFTEWMMDKTAGFEVPWNLSPEALVYGVNYYFDAVGLFINSIYSIKETLADNKDFDVKTDVPIISSFIGKKTSPNANKFSDLRSDMERRTANLSAFEDRAQFDAYIQAHPQDYLMTKLYSSLINGPLKELQTQEKQINSGTGFYSGLDERAKQILIRQNRAQKEQLTGEFVRSIEAIKTHAGID